MGADEKFVAEYEGLVRGIAHKTREEFRVKCELDDLIGFGFRGLLEARERFDPSRGVRFKSFAYYRIRGAIIDGVRKMYDLPRSVYIRLRAARALDAECESAGETRGAAPQMATDLEASLRTIDSVLTRVVTAYTVSAAADDARLTEKTPEEIAIAEEFKSAALAAIEQLPERERIVVRGFYFDDRSFEDIARQLGVSRSWANRIHGKALDLLREAFELSTASSK